MVETTAAALEMKGLKKVLRQVDPKILRGPLTKFLRRSGLTVEGGAKERAPVDTGLLRSSITTELDKSALPLFVKVGTNVPYAPYQEFGTGLLAEGQPALGGRHWPPAGALQIWAERHGFESGGAVAYAIGMRGGLRGKRYLTGSLEDNTQKVYSYLIDMAADLDQEIRRKV